MAMINMRHELDIITDTIHAVFLYAACTSDGYVKVGISRVPFDRIYDVHISSPSPVRAAQWVWVGSLRRGREIEKKVRSEWADRHTRGEWYRFDYADPADKQDFHDTLAAVFEVVVGNKPQWEKLGPKQVALLISAGGSRKKEGVKRQGSYCKLPTKGVGFRQRPKMPSPKTLP